MSKQLVSVVLTAGMVLSLAGCAGNKPKTEAASTQEPGILVETQALTTGELTLTTEFIGTVKPDEQVKVLPKVAGTVLATYAEVGQTVKKGDLLFEIDQTDVSLQVDIAAAGLDTARASAERALGSSYDLQLIQSEAQMDNAQVAYNNAKKRLEEFRDSEEETLDNLAAQEEAARQLVAAAEQMYQSRKADYEEAARRYKELLDSTTGIVPETPSEPSKETPKAETPGNATIQPVIPEENGMQGNTTPTPDDAQGNTTPTPDDAQGNTTPTPDAAGGNVESGVKGAYVTRQSRLFRAATSTELEEAKKQMEIKKGLMDGAMADYQAAMAQYKGAQQVYDSTAGTYDNNGDSLRIARYSAQVNYEAAEKSYDIAKNQGYVEATASAEAQLRQAEASYKAAAQQLEYTKVYAPIDGVIEQKTVEPQSIASQQNPAYVVSNKDNMMVTFYVSVDSVMAMREGDLVQVESGTTTYNGTIVEMGSMVDEQSGLFQIRAVVNDADEGLKTGLSVKVTATTARTEGNLLVPQSAIYYDSGEPYVYLVVNGVATRTPIVTGISNEEWVAVLAGLDASATLITSWHPNLVDGAIVRQAGETGQDAVTASAPDATASSPATSNQLGEASADSTTPSTGAEG